MKNLFTINEDERNRILNLHETATKGQYLNEQPLTNQSPFTPNPTTVSDSPLNIAPKSAATTTTTTKKWSMMDDVKRAQDENKPKKTSGYGVDYIKQAQKLLGVVDDGKFGPKTFEALKTKLGVPSTTQTTTVATNTTQTTTVAPSTTQTTTVTTNTTQTTGDLNLNDL